MPNALCVDGDVEEAAVHRQAERPLRLVRDLQDGFYALSIHPKYREAFTLKLDGRLLKVCALPMEWSLSPYTFQKITNVLVRKLRYPGTIACPGCLLKVSAKAKKKWHRPRRMRTGARFLPFVADFVVFVNGFDETMRRKDETFEHWKNIGLNIHLTKGYHTATQVGEHLGI